MTHDLDFNSVARVCELQLGLLVNSDAALHVHDSITCAGSEIHVLRPAVVAIPLGRAAELAIVTVNFSPPTASYCPETRLVGCPASTA